MLKRALMMLTVSACTIGSPGRAAELASVSRLAFGPDGVLFAADWKAAQVNAINLPPAAGTPDTPFNIMDLDAAIQPLLGGTGVRLESMAKRPGTNEVYVALSVGPERTPAILVVTPDGSARALDLPHLPATLAKLNNPPSGDARFWKTTPLRSFTVTDMQWHDGKLYVAGLSNGTFASTLRILSMPFGGSQAVTTVAMYHSTHNQVETRAPIRAMSFHMLNGRDTLVAAYLCSPIVTIPVDALKDGAHIEGKTVAELGYGDVANSMVTFAYGQPGKQVPAILLVNDQRDADVLPVSAIGAADQRPGLDKPVPFGGAAGVTGHHLPLGGVLALDNQNDAMFVAVRRDRASGRLQLVSINKMVGIRISDYVSEYDFPDYRYTADYQVKNLKPVIDMLEAEEGFGAGGKL